MLLPRRPVAFALLLGCPTAEPDPDPTPAPVESPDWCEDGRARSIAHGRRNAPIGVYPDDHYVLPDPATRTGVRPKDSGCK